MVYRNSRYRGRIGLLTPYLTSNRGNSTTARRIAYGLEKNGYLVETFAYNEELYDEKVLKKLESCDCLHIIHYYRFAKWLEETGTNIKVPYIITSGGTDVNVNLTNPTELSLMKSTLFNADYITVFTNDAKQKLLEQAPQLRNKIQIIPQSVWIPTGYTDNNVELPEGSPKLLLPAGLRPVKDVLYLREALLALKNSFPNLQFVIAGPILDEITYQEVEAFVERNKWVHYVGEIPLEMMANLYQWTDYVLNTSISEGQSSALLEAMSMGKIIMARKNAGNQSIINDKVNGILYDNPGVFIREILFLEDNKQVREEMGQRARDHVMIHFDLQAELNAYINLYEKIKE
jgi:glycosyltransferase involved in cell wall biosynthesis